MKRVLVALLLVAAGTASAQTTVRSWQELAGVVDRQAREIRDLKARLGEIEVTYRVQQDEVAVLRQHVGDVTSDLWLVIRQGNRTVDYALVHLCAFNAAIAPLQAVLPWAKPFPIEPHACPTAPVQMPYRILPPAPATPSP